MSNLNEMLQQRAALERQIKQAQVESREKAIAEVRQLMADHGLNAEDVVGGVAAKKDAGVKRPVAPKYQDPISGKTWTGRGLKPLWVQAALNAGQTMDDLAIKEAATA